MSATTGHVKEVGETPKVMQAEIECAVPLPR